MYKQKFFRYYAAECALHLCRLHKKGCRTAFCAAALK